MCVLESSIITIILGSISGVRMEDGPSSFGSLAPVCTGGGGAEAGRSVRRGAVHGVRQVNWPGGTGWAQAMAVVVHDMR